MTLQAPSEILPTEPLHTFFPSSQPTHPWQIRPSGNYPLALSLHNRTTTPTHLQAAPKTWKGGRVVREGTQSRQASNRPAFQARCFHSSSILAQLSRLGFAAVQYVTRSPPHPCESRDAALLGNRSMEIVLPDCDLESRFQAPLLPSGWRRHRTQIGI